MFDGMFKGMFGKIAPGMCRLSMSGGIAVKTSGGYKTYNVKKNKLTNCSNFVFDIGEDFFFVIPTNSVNVGDIILVNGKPRCVIARTSETIKVINYEDSTVEEILPERHVFMGNTYYYGKIVSVLGTSVKTGGMNSLMKYMMMSQIMGGKSSSDLGGMLPMMMLMNGKSFDEIFDGMFDMGDSLGLFEDETDTDDDEQDSSEVDA